MAEFNIEIVDQVLATCQTNAGEVSDALSRTMNRKISLEVEESGPVAIDALPPECQGPGLLILLKVEASAALLVLPESSGLLPIWYDNPDPTGESKLATLGQELGMTLLPDELIALEFETHAVENLAEVISRMGLGPKPGLISLRLTSDEKSTTAPLLWPIANPAAIHADEAANESPTATKPPEGTSQNAQGSNPPPSSRISDFNELPAYSRSLLRISVPVKVTLAHKRMKISDIVELGVGAIIEFDKSCDDALNVEIGDQTVAAGEAVKVGDKFGLRLTEVVMPEERYISLKGCRRVR
ncbi:MAG: FliM/FliN family flagellar motor switch protein [Pirellulaceae bacterium]